MRIKSNKKTFLVLLAIIVFPIFYQGFAETTYFTSFVANFLFKNNLHEIVKDRFYRSAEMSRSDLADTITRNHLKTVIDLRLNDDVKDSSGFTEQEITELNGAKYIHIPFSSRYSEQYESLSELVKSYKIAETPVLVHCSSGTHRAGVATAIWLLLNEKTSFEVAEEQISIKYGFIKLERKLKAFLQGKPTLEHILEDYKNNSESFTLTFDQWIEQKKLSSGK